MIKQQLKLGALLVGCWFLPYCSMVAWMDSDRNWLGGIAIAPGAMVMLGFGMALHGMFGLRDFLPGSEVFWIAGSALSTLGALATAWWIARRGKAWMAATAVVLLLVSSIGAYYAYQIGHNHILD